MSYSTGRRVVTTTTYSSGGGGSTRTVTTRNYNYGGGGDSSTTTNHYPGSRGFSSKFTKMAPLEKPTQRPQVVGRSSRKEAKNPFSGYKSQKYEDIKAECLSRGELFCDPEFPAEDDSIFFSRAPPRRFEWKRPGEICESQGVKPEFISSGASRFDVQQGELGDCWLLAAVASLTINQKLLDHVVPPEQNFEDDYCGIFKFNFWHQGTWEEIIVDDRLPTYYNQLVFMHSDDKNEFWSALLEKAYAKLVGSYEALKGGSTSEAMEDFTGGVTENIDLRKPPDNLFTIMIKASQRGSIMGCSIDADPSQLEARLNNGLVMGHAYSVTNVRMIDIQTPNASGKIPMVRVRNPWGNEAEWKGAWSDSSREWQYIPKEQKAEIGLTFDDDGEFWMSFSDWQKNFQKLEICNLGPDSLDEDEIAAGGKRWEATTEAGEWIPKVNAGGCRNYLDTFWTNPQYKVTVTDPDDDDDDDLCTILVGCLQKDRRKKRKEGLDMLTIGYVIYKMKDNTSGTLDKNFFKYNASVAKSPSFINLREICGRHKLSPGTYVIIPSTFEPNHKGEYLLRIFTEKANETSEIDEETGMVEQDRSNPYVSQNNTSRARKTSPWIYSDYMTYAEVVETLTRLLNEETAPTDEEQEQENALKASFRRIAGEDMEIDAEELKEILNQVFRKEFAFDGFTLDTCRSMVAMHDGDLTGKLGFEEFKELWNDLRKWKSVFKDKDADNSGNLNTYELRQALNCSGFRLSNRTYVALVLRYGDKNGHLSFSDFILCAIRLKCMLTSYRMAQEGSHASFAVDDFIQTTMYA